MVQMFVLYVKHDQEDKFQRSLYSRSIPQTSLRDVERYIEHVLLFNFSRVQWGKAEGFLSTCTVVGGRNFGHYTMYAIKEEHDG